MADVFISYKREERQAVERLAQELRRLGLDVWFDASLNAGEAFSDEIDREAHAAKAILVCWSPTARESQWVKSEALIGFEQRKLAACYVAGPDGFYPPTPFNSIHAEDLRAWVGAPSNTHAGYKSILRRIGALAGRADIESFGALDVQAPPSTLRAWIERHQSSPLFMAVDELLHVRDVEEAERTRLEQEARERRAREEAERREREAAARARAEAEKARQDAERSQREAERLSAAEAQRSSRGGAQWLIFGALGAAVLIALIVWSPWNNRSAPPVEVAPGESIARSGDVSPVSDGAAFRDCPDCPEMVPIAGGSFTMGSPASESNRGTDENQRRVTVAAFAAGRHEVTRGQWAAFVRDTGRSDPQVSGDTYCTWRSPGYSQDDNHPVACVNWEDAVAYVAWLSQRTGQRYRLLTEAEWEYAARAGTTTAYSTGASISESQARFSSSSTAAVGSHPPNSFGLHDMHGNVWEWVQDCYSDPYPSTPVNGSAYETSGCPSRVLRGGSWYFNPVRLRSAYRLGDTPSLRGYDIGFRVARTL